MSKQILRLPDVLERTGLSRSAVYAYAARGDFPRPIKLGPRSSGWVAADIDTWIEQRIKAAQRRSA